MKDKTASGISRSGIFSALYCVPSFYAITKSIRRPPTPEEARALLYLAFGGLAVLIVACTTLLPALLRHFGQTDRAASWRRAAFSGIAYSVVWTFLWTMLLVPLGSPTVRLAVALLGISASLVLLWWADRRWWHLDIFKRW